MGAPETMRQWSSSGIANDNCQVLLRSRPQRSIGARDRVSQRGHLLLGAACVFCVDGFVDTRDDDGRVARVFAGRVDGVFEPWATGQALLGEKVFFHLPKLGV